MALTGFLVNIGGGNASVCADGAANTIQAIGARFPYVGGSQPVLCNIESSVFTAPDIFTNTIKCHDLTGNQWYQYAHDLRLMACDPALPVAGVNLADPGVFDPVLGAAFWSFAMTFIFGCWLLAKNAGVILSVIRRF